MATNPELTQVIERDLDTLKSMISQKSPSSDVDELIKKISNDIGRMKER